MWVLPAETRSPLTFPSGGWATFPTLGTVPHIYLHRILCRKKKEKELLSFAAAWMELETMMLSEIHQSVKDKYHYDLTYKRNLMKKIIQ